MQALLRQIFRKQRSFYRMRSDCHRNSNGPALNDLPQPCGDFQKLNSSRQFKNNAILAFGIISVVASCVGGYQLGVFDMNYYPPDRPADREEK